MLRKRFYSFYNDLRTQQQLGYIVYSGLRFREGIYTLVFTVQSNSYDSYEIIDRILKYLANAVDDIDDTTEDAFESYKEGIISRKLEPDQRLTGQAGRFWSEIILSDTSGEPPNFVRHQQEARLIADLTLKDFKQFAREVLEPHGAKHHLLVSSVKSQKKVKGGTDKLLSPELFLKIGDPLSFMELWPSI